MTITLLILLLFVLISISGLLSASETALFSLPSTKVKAFKDSKDPRKVKVWELVSRPRDLLITIIMLNISVNIFVQNVVSSIFGDFSTWALNIGVPLGLTLVFGEVIPKSIGLANNMKLSYRAAPLIAKVQHFFSPIQRFLTSITTYVARFLFFFLKKEDEVSIDELEHTLKTSRQYGVLNEEEAELVKGYLHLEESIVKELMRPREEVLFFDLEEPLTKLIHLFVDQECSRIPICDGGLDKVIGIMTSRLFFLKRDELQTSSDLLPLLKKPFFIPEATEAEMLLRQMYAKRESLAIVVDEYGSVSGLISLEDLVEVVVGEIADRRDEKSRYTNAGEGIIIASGKLELGEFERIFDYTLVSRNNMVTIGGWLTEQLGDIPKAGAKYEYGPFLFHVLAADPNRVRRVYIRRLKPMALRKRKES